MRLEPFHIALVILVALVVGYYFGQHRTSITIKKEGFQGQFVLGGMGSRCGGCGGPTPCPACPLMSGAIGTGAGAGAGGGSSYKEPDMSKYVLKASVPPCPSCPDMSQYMLKTECPPAPDLSKYILKSSVPKPQPIIIDSSACKKECGECPPCPRPRCPDVKCPPPTKCPPPAPCPRPVCPPQIVKCKAEEASYDNVRPFLAPLSLPGFGMS
jgi:hypothetical protein